MSKFSEIAIDEMNREIEKQFEIDYECVQFGKWLQTIPYIGTTNNSIGLFWTCVENMKQSTYTTKELYQLYKNNKNK